MRILRNILLVFIVFTVLVITLPGVHAHCPLCTAATGAAVVASREAGLNDAIVGVFVGGLIISSGLWFNNILKKRYKQVPLQGLIAVFVSFVLTIITLKTAGLLNGASGIFGINNLLAGTITGTVVSISASSLSEAIKKKKSKTLFPFQTIVFTLVLLGITALIFYFITTK